MMCLFVIPSLSFLHLYRSGNVSECQRMTTSIRKQQCQTKKPNGQGVSLLRHAALLLLLDSKGICASSGSACTSGSLDPSHVLLSLGLPHEVAHGSLRLSLGEDITDEDADYIIEAVKDVVVRLRNMSPLWEDITSGKEHTKKLLPFVSEITSAK